MKYQLKKFVILVIGVFGGWFTTVSNAQQSEVTTTPIEMTVSDDSIRQNIESHLAIENGKMALSPLGFPRSNEYIKRKTQAALRAMGYYQPTIELTGDHQQWILAIELGKPITWIAPNFEILGPLASTAEFHRLISDHPFRTSLILNHGLYSEFKLKLQSFALEHGFLDASFSRAELKVDEKAYTAQADWSYNSGQQYTFSTVEFEGSRLSKLFLNEFLKIDPGQFYRQQDLLKTQQSLNQSGYFRLVDIEQNIDKTSKNVAILFNLIDQERYELKTSLGFGTDSGYQLGINWQDRQVNEIGHKYSISLDLNRLEKGISGQYRIPLDNINDEWLNRASYKVRDDSLASTTLATFESILLMKLSDHWSSQVAVTTAFEEVKENQNIQSHISYLVPSAQLDYYSVLNPFQAQDGWRWQQVYRIGNQALSSPGFDFLQTEQRLKKIWSLSDDFRAIFRTHIGYTYMEDDEFIQLMPTSYRFFAGGDVSVRGYDFRSLAPKDDGGQFVGGKHLLTATAEFDWRFKDDFRWAIFYDQGNAFNDWKSPQLKSSVGTGLRWITPFGSFRIDYARSLDLPNEWRWHITIGPDL